MTKDEKIILEMGLYVALPINMQILFTSKERDVLNSIRHCYNMGQSFVSTSVICLMTGLTEKTVKLARDSLTKMGYLEKGKSCGLGTHYKIHYKKLLNDLNILNNTPDPIERLELANKIRGNTIHKSVIKNINYKKQN